MIRLLFNCFILISISVPSFNLSAQTSEKFNIVGSRNIEDQTYIDLIRKVESKSRDEISAFFGNALAERGFFNSRILDFRIDSLTDNSVKTYHVNIDEGPPTYIDKIIIDSLDTEDSAEISDFFQFSTDEIFIQSELEKSIIEILTYFENIGYPFANITVKSLEFFTDENEEHLVRIYLSLSKGKQRRIDKVEIIGNEKTDEDFIINTTRLSKGEIYSQKRITEIPETLNKLRFFENIEIPKYFVNSKEEGILQISLKEKNTNSFDGILGYVPSSNSDESGYFTGFVNISLRNLFGTGRGAMFKWQQESSETQELEIGYLEPWVFNQPFNIGLQFFQRKQDSSFVKRMFGGSIEYLATENVSASLLFESESIIASVENSNQLALNSTSFISGISLKVDYRDNVLAPRSGTYFVSTYKYRNKLIGGEDNLPPSLSTRDIEYHNYELDFGIFYTLFTNQVIAFGVHAKEIVGDYFDLSDYFQFGGTNSLRGYREKQFVGNRIIWSNLEYRFLLSQSSYVFSFFDSGYYLINENKDLNILRKSDYKSGYGLGISLETALGVMRISYAFAEGGSISNGLIHFGLLNDF